MQPCQRLQTLAAVHEPTRKKRGAFLKPNNILSRSEQVSFELVAGEAILIHLQTGTYFSLNKVGTLFWNMLDGEQTIEHHASAIAQKYGVDGPMVVADMLELAEKLGAEALVLVQ